MGASLTQVGEGRLAVGYLYLRYSQEPLLNTHMHVRICTRMHVWHVCMCTYMNVPRFDLCFTTTFAVKRAHSHFTGGKTEAPRDKVPPSGPHGHRGMELDFRS